MSANGHGPWAEAHSGTALALTAKRPSRGGGRRISASVAQRVPLQPASSWTDFQACEEDWAQIDPAILMRMAHMLFTIRSFEETVLTLWGEGLVHGPAHSAIGQEGGAVGTDLPLRSDDHINGSHRGHHQFLAKALTTSA